MEKFNPLDYWGRLAIHLSEENARLRNEILCLHIAIEGLKTQFTSSTHEVKE